MKNTKKIIGLATMFFTVATLAVCGAKDSGYKNHQVLRNVPTNGLK